MMVVVYTDPCLGCGASATFVMTEEQFFRYQSGEPVQHVFPNWSDDDREMLVSGTCPTCFEETFPEEEEDYWDEDWFPEEDSWGLTPSLLDPESDDFTYERDWYVD